MNNEKILNEINRFNEILGLPKKEIINESWLTKLMSRFVRNSADDILRSSKGVTNITDEVVRLAKEGKSAARRQLTSSPTHMIGNIAMTYGDDVAKRYIEATSKIAQGGKTGKYAKYFDESGNFMPNDGQRDGILRVVLGKSGKTTTQAGGKATAQAGAKTAAQTGGKATTKTIATRAKGPLAGVSDDVVKRYREIEQAAKNSDNINPKTNRQYGWSESGKWNPSEGARNKWLKQAIQDVGKKAGPENVKQLTWGNWLFIGGLIGVSGLLLWNVLSTDEENSPIDIPPTPPTDEDTQTTGSEEGTTTIEPWYEGDLCSRTLQRGRIGDDVEELQTKLNNVYNFGLELDGKFGPLTKNAVMEFQRKNQLEVDGIFDENDCEKLNGLSTTTTTSTGTTETTTPTVVEPETLSTEVQDTAIQQELQNKPEEVIAVVAEPQTDQLETDEVAKVEATKKCKEGKTPVLVKFKEKQVNRGGKMINKTVAVYRCKKLNDI